MVVIKKENNIEMIMDVRCGELFKTPLGDYYILTNQVLGDTYYAVNVKNGNLVSFPNGFTEVIVVKGAEITIPA